VSPLGGAGAEDPGAPTINAKKHRRRAPGGAEAGDPEASTINVKMSTVGPLGGAEAGDLGAPTISVKNIDDMPPWEAPVGGSGPHPGSKRCVINLHRHDRQKVILLTSPILSALSSIMAHDP
jgi:hypothetical protein